MKNLLLSSIAAALLATACASSDTTVADDSVSDREYQTGSSIPRKKGTNTTGAVIVNPESMESGAVNTKPAVAPRGM